jgi:hypothetical protein
MKISAHKKVWWDANGREIEGKVKQLLSTHVVVAATDGTEYIVQKAILRTAPIAPKG